MTAWFEAHVLKICKRSFALAASFVRRLINPESHATFRGDVRVFTHRYVNDANLRSTDDLAKQRHGTNDCFKTDSSMAGASRSHSDRGHVADVRVCLDGPHHPGTGLRRVCTRSPRATPSHLKSTHPATGQSSIAESTSRPVVRRGPRAGALDRRHARFGALGLVARSPNSDSLPRVAGRRTGDLAGNAFGCPLEETAKVPRVLSTRESLRRHSCGGDRVNEPTVPSDFITPGAGARRPAALARRARIGRGFPRFVRRGLESNRTWA